MNEALISIGSNENREHNIHACQRLLSEEFADIKYSATSVTIPYGESYKNDFLNQLVIVSTDKTKEEVCSILKAFEKRLGRDQFGKGTGRVIIDIDLVVWNNEVLKSDDMKRSYVQDLLYTFS